jgi:NAD(P)H-nitrite reductase large subunit
VTKFNYLIIGNSAGAIGCVEGLRSVDQEGTLALIAEEAYHTYSRALLPYYLSGKINLENIYYRPPDFYHKFNVTPLLGKKAVRINFKPKEVELANGEQVGYEKLLLATGASTLIPPLTGLDKKNIFSFLSLSNTLQIEKILDQVKNVVILGGGVIGLMIAEVLKKRGLNVWVVELAERILAPVVDETASKILEALFRENGIEILTKTTIKEIVGKEKVERIVLTNGRSLLCDLLILTAGTLPRVELVKGTEVKVNKGIIVNKKMQTSVPDIYACGDCAEVYDSVTDTYRVIPLWPNAYVGGKVAGYNMAGLEREYNWGISMNSMHFFGLYVISAGINVTRDNEKAFEVLSKLDQERKIYRKFALANGQIKGLLLMREITRAGVLINLMRRKINVRDFQAELLRSDFGYSNLPDELRWQLLKDDVLLGVV